ncbi:MAG: ribosome assembly factor SBDS [Candidatus Woesearchaeota archaeon]
MAGFSFDREKLHLNIARIHKANQTFEIAVDPDLAMELRQGKNVDIIDVLKSEKVFSDVRKGLLASEHVMKSIFGTSDPMEVAKIIIAEGEVPVSAAYKERQKEEKIKRIIDIIHRNGVDPKTHLPHPITRIENAMEEAKVKIDDHKSAEDQVMDILKDLRVVLPIRFEMKEIAVKISPEYAAKSYSTVKSFGTILREDWQSDGSWSVVVEIAGGMESDFYDKINALTHGNVETKVLNTK